MPHPRDDGRLRRRRQALRRTGLVVVFLWFTLGGLGHFVWTDAVTRIVPASLPWARELVLASGVFEWLGAAGLLWRRSRRAAGWGLFALTIAVTPANVTMLLHADAYAVPHWLLVARLPFQLLLLALILWSTTPRSQRG